MTYGERVREIDANWGIELPQGGKQWHAQTSHNIVRRAEV